MNLPGLIEMLAAPLIITSTVVAYIATLEISSVLESRRGAVPQAGATGDGPDSSHMGRLRARSRSRLGGVMTTQPKPTSHRNVLEVVATVLLALAAVSTAWSGYQAARWNGEATKASSRVNTLR